jgi:hypothetical protein
MILNRYEKLNLFTIRQEVYKYGMVEAAFTPQNKLIHLEMAFDVMSFMQQLRRTSGRYDFQVHYSSRIIIAVS